MFPYRYSDPEADTDSNVQPGNQVFDYQLPPEVPGTLEIAGYPVSGGQHSTVFKGVLSSPGGGTRTVAIKRLRLGEGFSYDQFRRKVKRETVIGTAAHPNILPFIGYQIVKNVPMLVSPWCENGNLSAYIYRHPDLTRNGKIDLASCRLLAMYLAWWLILFRLTFGRCTQLCHAARGLLHLHNLDAQIVHGKIHPKNVIVQDNLVAALCNPANIHIPEGPCTGMTASGKTVNPDAFNANFCYGYGAKELLNGGPATPAADVYAFGGLILAAMSGQRPFWRSKNQNSTIIAIFHDQTPAREDHPQFPANDPLWDLLSTCWSGEPEGRPSMLEVLRKLEDEREPDVPLPVESLVQPGHFIFNRELPEPITGELIKTRELAIRGGFGDVFQGSWVQPNADPVSVVIKCVRPLDQSEDERFRVRVKRETLIWGLVKHPNILPFFGHQIVDGVPMLVSPWCEHGNLEIYTKAHPELTHSNKIELLCGAARGLLYLHSLDPPIYHGDLKPQNVIVRDNLEAVLCDFGISKIILGEGENSGWTTVDYCRGTPGFLAKETLGSSRPTTAADVYAFSGVILATMSGHPPFWNKARDMRTIAVYNEETPNPVDHSELPQTDPLWVLMRECWSSVPESRPHSADLLNRLEAETSSL